MRRAIPDSADNARTDILLSHDELVSRALALVPQLRAAQERTETERRVPRESFEALMDADLYRLMMPRRHGGFEAGLDTYVDVAFEIARGCGSTGWVFAITCQYQMLVAMFPAEAQDDVWGQNPRAISAASFPPSGQAEAMDGGVRLGGTWMYCSGIDICDWMIVGAKLGSEAGYALVPKAEFEIEDNWHVVGLAGTGSKNVTCEDVFVPAHRFVTVANLAHGRPPGAEANTGDLFKIPLFTAISVGLVAALMGMAQGAYDESAGRIGERITSGVSVTQAVPMAEIPAVQLRVAEAASSIAAARALIDRDCRELMATIAAGRELSVEQRARFKGNQAFVARLVTGAADLLFKGGGGGGLFNHNRVQRYWRDVNAGAMHIAINWDAIGALSGRVALGLAPDKELF